MLVAINKAKPTITIHLENGKGNVNLTAAEFVKLYTAMTKLYNAHYEDLEENND